MKAIPRLHAKELSIVDRGANRKKPFPIFKQEKNTMTNEEFEAILKAVLETELEGEEAIEALVKKMGISEKGANAAKAVVRLLSGFEDEMPVGFMKALGETSGCFKTTVEVKKADPPKKGAGMQTEEEIAAEKKKLEGLPEAFKKQFEDTQKAHDLEVKALKESNEVITKALQNEKDIRELQGWTEKAKAELSHYPGKSIEELAKSLKELHDVNPELAEDQFKSMKTASDALKESEIFKNAGNNFGGGGGNTNSAWDKIQKMAEGLVEKSEDMSMTQEKAIAKVCEARPELYTAYIAEQEAAAR